MNKTILATLLFPMAASAAPVAINTSILDRPNEEKKMGVGFTFSTAQRPFIAIEDQKTALPYFSYRNGNFYIEGVDFGFTLQKNKNFKLDLVASPRFYESKESFAKNNELQGIDETKPTYFGGISAQFNFKPATLTLILVKDLLESSGIEAAATVSKGFKVSKNLALIPAFGMTWQNAELVDYFYGVTPSEVQPGRGQYDGKSTLNYNVSLTLSLDVNPQVQIIGLVKYETLGEGITNSTIVDEESTVQAAIGAVYRF